MTDEEIMTLAHRMASKYEHNHSADQRSYGFVKHTLLDFVRKVTEGVSSVHTQEPVGEVLRTGLSSNGTPWHTLFWYNETMNVPNGTKLYTHPAPQPAKPTPDCRTCVKAWPTLNGCSHNCTNGDQYQPAPAVVLWRTIPIGSDSGRTE